MFLADHKSLKLTPKIALKDIIACIIPMMFLTNVQNNDIVEVIQKAKHPCS
jgi:hypothetical protein